MRPLIIRDGYTLQGRFAEDGWPTLTFRYRPASSEDVEEYQLQRTRAASGKAIQQTKLNFLFPKDATGKALDPRVVSWDLADETTAGAAAVNAELFRKLPPTVQAEIINHVCSYSPGEQAEDAKN